MGTILNGNKWSGAAVNGNIITGLAKNGNVFYKKETSIYKRRIMVGDNLGLKTIYGEFPSNLADFIYDDGYASPRYDIECGNNKSIYDFKFMGSGAIYVNNISIGNNITALWSTDGISYLPAKVNEDSLIVNKINDNEVYRCLLIEDENIRPLKVGDKIIPGTKFYGVVPEEPNLNGMYTSIYDTTGKSIAYFNFSKDAFVNELQIKTNQYSYTQMYSKSQFLSINNSVLISEVSYTIGDISDSENNPNYKYLLVDTTTLG